MSELHYTFDQIGELTLPQIRCLAHGGKPPSPGRRTFAGMTEAEAYRQSFKDK